MNTARINRPFVAIYKATYLTLIVANLVMLYTQDGFRDGATWVISIVVLLLNVSSWIVFLQRWKIGQISEEVLSVGRIVVVLLAALVFFADVIALYSPVGLVLWLSLLHFADALESWRFVVWWLACASLLSLECVYFRSVSDSRLFDGARRAGGG